MTTLAELAGICRVTEQAVSQWIKAGMPVKEPASMGGRGGSKPAVLDLEACMRWYFSTNFERFELERARSRLANEQADSAALRNAEVRDELVRLPVIEKIIGNAVTVLRANTLALPTKLAPELEGLSTPEIKAVLDREARAALEAFAAYDLGPTVRRIAARAGDGDAATAADGQPVGRRAPNRKRRGKRKAGKVAHRDG